MKFFLITILLCPFISLAQYLRRTNVAIMETDSLSGIFLFKVWVEMVESEGYQLTRSDYSTLTLRTEPVEIHDLPLFFRLEIQVKGTHTSIRGYIRDGRNFSRKGFPESPESWEDAAFRSFRRSTWCTGFEIVAKMVEKIRSRTSGKIHWYRRELSPGFQPKTFK